MTAKTSKRIDLKKLQWVILIPANLAAAAAFVWFLGLKPYPVPADTPAFWQEAKTSRKVTVGIEDGAVIAKCWVPSEPGEFVKMLLDAEHYPEMFPSIPKMKQLTAAANETAASGTLRVVGPIAVSFSFDLKAVPRPGGAYLLQWDGTGTGLGVNTGEWEIRQFGGGSAVVSHVHLVPDGKLVPMGPWNHLMVPFVRHSLSFLGVES